MAVDPTRSASGGQSANDVPISTAEQRANSLGSDAFLKLLIVQLQNQDPTSPQSNTEFIAQLATFSSLEQLTSINKAVSEMAGFFSAVGDAKQALDNTSAN